MKRETAHLCALALSTYTEILGGLVTGNLKKERESRKNYESFLPYLGKPYVELNEELVRRRTSLFHEVRSKLVHEFSPREQYFILITDKETEKSGMEYPSFGESLPIDFKHEPNTIYYPAGRHLNFYLKEYYRDFKNAVEKYHSDLVAQTKSDIFDRQLLTNFHDATVVRA